MKRRYCKHVICQTCMQQCSHNCHMIHMTTSAVPQCLSCQRRERLCAAERIIQSYLPLLVPQTPSLCSNASPPPALLTQLSYPRKLHACRANNYFLYIFLLFFALCIQYCSQLYYTEQQLLFTPTIFFNIFSKYLRQIHQIIHLSPEGCFTPARGKTVQKNREVSGINSESLYVLYFVKVLSVQF